MAFFIPTNICYILHSAALNQLYVGASHEGIEQRLLHHNTQYRGGKHFKLQVDDWKVFIIIECSSYAHAMKGEIHIKKMKSSKYIQNLKDTRKWSKRFWENKEHLTLPLAIGTGGAWFPR